MSLKHVILSLAVAATPAAAQPAEHPAATPAMPATPAEAASHDLALSLEITAPVDALDADLVATALAAELGVRVVAHDAFAPALGRLHVVLAGDVLRVTYHPAEGARIERTVATPATHADRVQLIAFVAGNLVRDQVSELLASLTRALAAEPAAAPPIAAPVAPESRAPAATVPAPERRIPVALGLIPPLATDRLSGERVIVGAGVHAVFGMTDGSTTLSVSGVADVQRRFAHGVQVGGVAAVTRRLHGIQLGGAAAVAGQVQGLQVGGAASIAGPVRGLQLGGAAALGEHVQGGQVGGAIAVADQVRGLQVGGAVAVADHVRGLQLGGAASIGGEVSGMQIGVVNVARRMRGVQLGVINISDDGDDAIPIGVLNFVRNGRVELDGWIESTQLSAVAVRHGPRRVHNLVGFAWSPDHDHVLVGFGLGIHRTLARDVTLDLDAVNWWTDIWHGTLGQLEQLRATVAVPVGPVDLLAGAAANVCISDGMDESANFHPVIARRVTSGSGVHVVSWPSVFAGVRMRAR